MGVTGASAPMLFGGMGISTHNFWQLFLLPKAISYDLLNTHKKSGDNESHVLKFLTWSLQTVLSTIDNPHAEPPLEFKIQGWGASKNRGDRVVPGTLVKNIRW